MWDDFGERNMKTVHNFSGYGEGRGGVGNSLLGPTHTESSFVVSPDFSRKMIKDGSSTIERF